LGSWLASVMKRLMADYGPLLISCRTQRTSAAMTMPPTTTVTRPHHGLIQVEMN
jgi:hypothetical protein